MYSIQKTAAELHRDLLASGLFDRLTQMVIASEVGVNQATVSRIANGHFKRVNKTLVAVCKYAGISTVRTAKIKRLHTLVATAQTLNDPEKKKLVDIIQLAMDLLERP